jgi:hypothetical protein
MARRAEKRWACRGTAQPLAQWHEPEGGSSGAGGGWAFLLVNIGIGIVSLHSSHCIPPLSEYVGIPSTWPVTFRSVRHPASTSPSSRLERSSRRGGHCQSVELDERLGLNAPVESRLPGDAALRRHFHINFRNISIAEDRRLSSKWE